MNYTKIVILLSFFALIIFNIKVYPQENNQWIPLIENSDISYDAIKLAEQKERFGEDFNELSLSNGTRLRLNNWNNFLKDFILSLPENKQHYVLDGMTRMTYTYDNFEKSIRFEPLRLLSGIYSTSSYISFRGLTTNNTTTAFLLIRYVGDDWLFVNRLSILLDGEVIRFNPNSDFERNVRPRGKVEEYISLTLSESTNKELAKKMANANSIQIRFEGRQFYQDFVVSEEMLNDFKAIFIAISLLSN